MKYLILSNNDPSIFTRQIPVGLRGNFEFLHNENETYDCILVYDQLPVLETGNLQFKKLVLIHGEPPTIKKYKHKFNAQFDAVITSHIGTSKKIRYLYQQFLPWHIGYFKNKVLGSDTYNYEYFNKTTFIKNKEICVISSNKNYPLRLRFLDNLIKYYGKNLDVYGRGFNVFVDKIDFLTDYKYCIVLENSSLSDYWTEKLSDAYLANCYPIYWGCTNIERYFNPNSYTNINIQDPSESIRIINSIINSNCYEKKYSNIILSKDNVLNKFNIYNAVNLDCLNKKTLIKKTIKSEDSFISIKQKIKNGLLK